MGGSPAMGHISPTKGIPHTEEVKRRISETKKRKFRNGEYKDSYPFKK
jgi:hypothetical protein